MPDISETSVIRPIKILRSKRIRLVETYVQTVTEILVNGQPCGFLVCDTIRSMEVNEEFMSDYSLHEPRSREATMTIVQSWREAWY